MTNTQNLNQPPIAQRRAHSFSHHGISVDDAYAWLRDPDYPDIKSPEILSHLSAENDWFSSQMAPLEGLTNELFEELKARQPQDDASVPYQLDGWIYQWRFAEGAQYRTWWRWPVGTDNSELKDREICFLDEPKLAGDLDFFRIGGMSVSPNGQYLAYGVDTNGSERYTVRVQDLFSDTLLAEQLENTGGDVTWARDSKTLFYTVLSEQWRPYVVKRHSLGDSTLNDTDVYTESDDSFFVGVSTTQSDAWIVISSGDHITSELRVLPSNTPTAEPQLIAPRNAGHEYDIDHRTSEGDDHFYILTNDTHKNFRLAKTKVVEPEQHYWQTVIEGSDEHYLTDFVCFDNLLVIEERVQGLDQIRLIDNDNTQHYIDFPEPTYSAGVGTNPEPHCALLRIGYNSMVTPTTVWDYNPVTRELITRKVQEIPSGYDAKAYVSDRRMITARDGVEVPVSLVHRKDTVINPETPLYLYGYGAYGSAIPPGFSTSRLSLLDRGFVFAIAHIRGGDDLGYHWYEAGKLANRTNTFNDFVDVARSLIDSGTSAAGRIAIAGGSAGGELMGAVVNQAPELWGAVVSHVPFVDVLNTMCDAQLPLTPMEWPEWGNPLEDKAAFEYIRSYSPYDQLQAGEFPPMLVTAGLNDPRVTYWEPAKYVAKLRYLKTDTNRLLLKTNMGAGHSGKSGRFDSLKEVAEEYAFLLRELNVAS